MLKTKLSSNSDVDPAIIQDYKDFLSYSLIPEIKKELQMMDSHFTWKVEHIGKEFELIYTFIHDVSNDHGHYGQKLFENLIEKGALPSYLLTLFEKDEEQLVFDAIVYRACSRLNRSVTYKDLLDLAPQKQG
ncbi:hypothetical protein [Bacillus salipaludis]|uniref:hypothetical protein n=1 Tax=Bacillus salipaludis TaxID=2547811 RepID=UPI002E2316D0|nr:hypothetical protein [Bacillus salipaludis]